MKRSNATLPLLVAIAVTAVGITPCPPADISHPGDEAVHAAYHAAAGTVAAARTVPADDGWCSGPPAPTAHLAPICPCGCHDRSPAAGSSLGWMLLPSPRAVLAPLVSVAFAPSPPLPPSALPVPVEHVPIG